DGTAVAGTDYVMSTGPLTFAPGETLKTFPVPIINNFALDGTRTLNVTLSAAVGAGIDCAGITMPTCTTSLSIQDDDRPGSIAFDASFYTVKEDAGTLNVVISRTGGLASGVTVGYAAIDGSAGIGVDYSPPLGSPTGS